MCDEGNQLYGGIRMQCLRERLGPRPRYVNSCIPSFAPVHGADMYDAVMVHSRHQGPIPGRRMEEYVYLARGR